MRIKFKFILSLLIFSISFLLLFASCAKKTKSSVNAIQTQDKKKKLEVDVDLTKLNSLLVYSEVFNMLIEPEKYIGKTIRMKGNFYTFAEEDKTVFYCVIPDATACCTQGLEFRLKNNFKYPSELPKENSEIIVSGIFFHEEGIYDLFGIRDAILENVNGSATM